MLTRDTERKRCIAVCCGIDNQTLCSKRDLNFTDSVVGNGNGLLFYIDMKTFLQSVSGVAPL